MIPRFHQVTYNLFRGGAPSPSDVVFLYKNYGINKIVSLDQLSADKINSICNILNIDHIVIPINLFKLIPSLLNLCKYSLKDLLLDGRVFVHCKRGADRTGFIIALLQCKYLDKTPEQALQEAKSLGFGNDKGDFIYNRAIKLFEKLIKNCKSVQDVNAADIVSNEREYIGDNRDSYLDEGHQGSFAPYLPITREYPYDDVYNYLNDQSPTRENYNKKPIKYLKDNIDHVPLVGQYDNNSGVHGVGPVEPVGGSISE